MKAHFKRNELGIDFISVEGDLDYHSSSELRAELDRLVEFRPNKVLINLSGVPYIDSSGIAVFIELYQKLKRTGGKVVFHNVPEAVLQVLELAKLNLFFPIVKTEKEAVALVG